MTKSELICLIWTRIHDAGFYHIDAERYAENIANGLLEHGLNLREMHTTTIKETGGMYG